MSFHHSGFFHNILHFHIIFRFFNDNFIVNGSIQFGFLRISRVVFIFVIYLFSTIKILIVFGRYKSNNFRNNFLEREVRLGIQKLSLWSLQVYLANFLVESRQNITIVLEVEPDLSPMSPKFGLMG